jgi:hypothetical protein
MAHTTIFLGAGFSFAMGLPLMSNFPRYAEQHPGLSADEKKFVLELQKLARDSTLALDLAETNLEAMLSVAIMKELSSDLDIDINYRDYALRARSILRSVCIPDGFSILQKLPIYTSKISGMIGKDFKNNPGSKITIITTNYDVVAEFAFYLAGAPAHAPGVTLSSSGNQLYRPNPGNVTICKIHGSTNWKQEIDGAIFCDDFVQHGQISDQNHSLNQASFPNSWASDPTKSGSKGWPEDPFIIPPTLYKSESHKAMRPIWKAAGKALRESSKIAFVGFSFPNSDTYLKYFIGTNLRDNFAADTIDIIDPMADEIVEKLKSKPFGFGSTIHNRLRPIKSKWESGAAGTFGS